MLRTENYLLQRTVQVVATQTPNAGQPGRTAPVVKTASNMPLFFGANREKERRKKKTRTRETETQSLCPAV